MRKHPMSPATIHFISELAARNQLSDLGSNVFSFVLLFYEPNFIFMCLQRSYIIEVETGTISGLSVPYVEHFIKFRRARTIINTDLESAHSI